MPNVEQRLSEMGIVLPKPWVLPTGITIPVSLVRVRGKRVLVSGHVPLDPEGAVAGPFGRVDAEVSAEQGQQAARAVLLAILASLKHTLGDLDRIGAWLRVYGPDPTVMLVAKSAVGQAATWSAAKRERLVFATGVPATHSAPLTRLIATAVRTCCRRALARPM